MRTPSLRIRLIVGGVVTVAALILALDVFVYLSLREELEENLTEILASRAALTRELAATVDGSELVQRLASAGVPAILTTADGRVLRSDPQTIRPQGGPPAGQSTLPRPLASMEQPLPGGGTVTVFASRAGVASTLRQVLLLEIVGSIVGIALAVIVLSRFSSVILKSLDDVVATARRIATGHTGERLQPDRPETELGRLAAAFDEMLEALERAVQDARDAEARTRRFLADAAHQLRTPVAGIRASIETLAAHPDEAESERLFENVARETARLSRLVGSLLLVAQLDRGEYVAPLEPVDFLEVVRREHTRAVELAPGLSVVLQTEHDVLPIRADESALSEAIANLLDNARRHADSRITIRVFDSDDHLRLEVEDDGPGVADADAEHIFERFVSGASEGGAGLGLPIARAIARQHGGDLVWRNGAFVLTLPSDVDAPSSADLQGSFS